MAAQSIRRIALLRPYHCDAMFRLRSPYQPMGDQPEAIAQLVDGLARGERHQTLLGATGTGKTFTMANARTWSSSRASAASTASARPTSSGTG